MRAVRWEIQLDVLRSEGPDSLAHTAMLGIYWQMCYSGTIISEVGLKFWKQYKQQLRLSATKGLYKNAGFYLFI